MEKNVDEKNVDIDENDEDLDRDLYESLDPRVKDQLEKLNKWTDRINCLEKRFEHLNSEFRCSLSESSDKLKHLSSKLGKCVDEARPFYDAKQQALEAQLRCQKAAIQFEKACKQFEQAKETINLAEIKFTAHAENSTNVQLNSQAKSNAAVNKSSSSTLISKNENNKLEFDCTWQEMLNQATVKLSSAEQMRKQSAIKHERCMQHFMRAQEFVHSLAKQLKNSIKKSKIYFDEQKRFQEKLNSIKTEIETLSHEITESKYAYSMTLKSLETISEEIHEKRNKALLKCLKREPGVGAEKSDLVDEQVTNTLKNELLKLERKRSLDKDKDKDDVPQINVNSSLCQMQLQIQPKSLVVFEDDPSTSSLNETFKSISLSGYSSRRDSFSSTTLDTTQDESFEEVCLE